jgi:DNA-binding transcriptional LysR family regulator
VRKLCDTQFGLYASPGYLSARAAIKTVSDLAGQSGIVFRGGNGQLWPWKVQDGLGIRDIMPATTLVVTDGQAMVDATALGFGVAHLINKVAEPLVDSGRLIHVLPEADVAGMPVHALIPSGPRMPSRTRIVLNQIADFLR